jgi:hypothetical protein
VFLLSPRHGAVPGLRIEETVPDVHGIRHVLQELEPVIVLSEASLQSYYSYILFQDTIIQGSFFRKVAYTRCDVAWFKEWMDFSSKYIG